MDEGPWNYKGNVVILAEYDGFTKPSLVKLDSLEIWLQIHDLPDGFYPLIKPLARKVGEYIYAEPKSQDFEGNFYRVRIRIDVHKPLKTAVSLVHEGKRQIFKVKYERLPDWCAVCGHLGHQYKEHGDGIHAKSALVFKELHAGWFRGAGPGPGQNPNGGRGVRGGRGRGAGRTGQTAGRGATTEFYSEAEDEHDTAMTEADENRKRTQDEMKAKLLVANPPAQVAPADANILAGKTPLMLPAPPPPPVSPSSKQEPKRTKMSTEKVTKIVTTLDPKSASSTSEERRGQ